MKKSLSQKTYRQLLLTGVQQLRKSPHGESAQRDAQLLLAYASGMSREQLILGNDRRALSVHEASFNGLIGERSEGYSVAAICNSKHFYSYDFFVNTDVLIPRPETEVLVERAIEILKSSHSPSLLDVGTGSGCIAISCALQVTDSSITAIDNSKAALSVAQYNKERFSCDNVTLQHVGVGRYSEADRFDVVAANLPYVPESQFDRSVAKEPGRAIFSGKDGLDHYRILARRFSDGAISADYLLVEHLPEQYSAINTLFEGCALKMTRHSDFITEMKLA